MLFLGKALLKQQWFNVKKHMTKLLSNRKGPSDSGILYHFCLLIE